jgi:hypothetical protein
MWITVATPSFTDLATFDRVVEAAGIPDGMLTRHAGTAEDGTLRVIVLWETREHAERFYLERLGPAFARVFGEPTGRPDVIGITVERSYEPAH